MPNNSQKMIMISGNVSRKAEPQSIFIPRNPELDIVIGVVPKLSAKLKLPKNFSTYVRLMPQSPCYYSQPPCVTHSEGLGDTEKKKKK